MVTPSLLRGEDLDGGLAFFGGPYNNHLALRAAIEDARSRGASRLFCLGDLGGFGPNPGKIYPLLQADDIDTIAGNYDRSLAERLSDCGCGYTHPDDNRYAQLSYDYTDRRTTDPERAWLAALPEQAEFKRRGRRYRLCHGSPRRVNEFLWESASSDAFLERLARESGADTILCTHTGLPWQRLLPGGARVINVGAVGRPANDGRTEVCYAWLPPDSDAAEFVPISYDHEALAREMEEEDLPAPFIETIRTGWWTTCLEILPAKERARGKH